MKPLSELQTKFKKYTGLSLDIDMSIFPILQHTPFAINTKNKKQMGQVFTPLQIVDHMIQLCPPLPNKYNMDLCAGRGQFTIRMLRYFTNTYPDFDLSYYMKHYHWFNEYNIDNAMDIANIFGNSINLLVGPAQQISKMPVDKNDIFLRGTWIWYQKKWQKL